MIRVLAAAAVVAALAAVPASSAGRAAVPGVTANQILLGGTGPLTGAESAYKPVLTGAQAYFAYVNAHGGVYGRKIVYQIEDDQYDPTQTVSQTQKLVEQDHVFAIFNSIGTEQAVAVSSYLNQQKVPQLFVGSGATAIGNNHAKTPWTMGLLPSFEGEGAVYGRVIATHPNAKIGVLYENDEYGKELLAGLKRGLGSHAGQIVSTASYVVSDVTVASQVQQLKAAGADTFVIFALPAQAIQAFVSGVATRLEPDGVRHVGVDRPRRDADRPALRGEDRRHRRDVDGVPPRSDEPDAAERRRREALQGDHEEVPAERGSERRRPPATG